MYDRVQDEERNQNIVAAILNNLEALFSSSYIPMYKLLNEENIT